MTDTIWAIIQAIVATVAFAVGFHIAAENRELRDNTRNIEREIPFDLFLEAYGKAPDRWVCLPYYVRYGKDDVRFENYADYRKYQKWREKRKRDAETERKREANEALYREIRSDLMPTPPTTGSAAIKPNPNFTPPPTVYKPTSREAVLEEIKKYSERKQWGGNPLEKAIEQAILNQSKQGQKFGYCGNCIYYKFDKGDNSPFGYCVRNDEIVNEASVKGCFEPKSKAEERPEPLGTVTTH